MARTVGLEPEHRVEPLQPENVLFRRCCNQNRRGLVRVVVSSGYLHLLDRSEVPGWNGLGSCLQNGLDFHRYDIETSCSVLYLVTIVHHLLGTAVVDPDLDDLCCTTVLVLSETELLVVVMM